jgi:hypothetical protein
MSPDLEDIERARSLELGESVTDIWPVPQCLFLEGFHHEAPGTLHEAIGWV